MEVEKVHCFFEQSGTFKNEFIKLGIPAEDYDIQNNFGQTDHVIDLFSEIEKAYDGKDSVFDNITPPNWLSLSFLASTFVQQVKWLFIGVIPIIAKRQPKRRLIQYCREQKIERFSFRLQSRCLQ